MKKFREIGDVVMAMKAKKKPKRRSHPLGVSREGLRSEKKRIRLIDRCRGKAEPHVKGSFKETNPLLSMKVVGLVDSKGLR